MTQTTHVAIIGAGPAGLSAARHLTLRNIHYTQFERHSDVGGIWDIDNPGSPMYRSAHFISSSRLSGFYGFPMPTEFPDYPDRQRVLDYTRSFAKAFDLYANLKLSTAVSRVSGTDGDWRVEYGDGQVSSFSHVICANGHTWSPNWPEYEGEFSGESMHAVDFQDPTIFEGKRVLVVGGGNSAFDIACDAARHARFAAISMRRGYHIIPKHIFGVPTDQFGERTKWLPLAVRRKLFARILRLVNGDLTKLGLKAPDHRVLASHPIINSQLTHHLRHGDIEVRADIKTFDGDKVVFADDREERYDLVLYATGYHYDIPYIDPVYFDWKASKPQLDFTVFNERHPTLFAAGFTEMNAGGYFIFDEMTGLIASAIDCQSHHPIRWDEARRAISGRRDFSGALKLVDSERHVGYLDIETFLRRTARLTRLLGWPDAKSTLEPHHRAHNPDAEGVSDVTA
ncbi:MAG: NAD(P)-binding domain-containing protein [Pseudomonadota bacterium]